MRNRGSGGKERSGKGWEREGIEESCCQEWLEMVRDGDGGRMFTDRKGGDMCSQGM